MPKTYSVTARLQAGREFYIATFRESTGNRVTKGLGTNDAGKAKEICGGLERLWNLRVHRVEDVPADGVHPDATKLYFGVRKDHTSDSAVADSDGIDEILVKVRAELAKYPAHLREPLMPLLLDRARLRRECEGQRAAIVVLKQDKSDLQTRVEKLESSVLVKTMESAAQSPTLSEALVKYEESLKARCTAKHVKDMVGRAREFIKTVDSSLKVSAVTGAQIAEFIGRQSLDGDERYKATRYEYWHVRLGAFFNWAAGRWKYISQMQDVEDVDSDSVDREKGDIHWHEFSELEAAIAAAPGAYWKALIGMLGYAGLQLAELVWLRSTDVLLTENGGTIWVTTVEDSEDPAEVHKLKRRRRKRTVNIHSKHLLPLLRDYVQAGFCGKQYFFAIPKGIRGAGKRWRLDSLSTKLRGHRGGKNRKQSTGLLPVGMNALSLRRTFGSLLLRSGKTIEQVAAALGNTPEVCDKHYARLKGCEVEMNF